jgi:hypothetical protein
VSGGIVPGGCTVGGVVGEAYTTVGGDVARGYTANTETGCSANTGTRCSLVCCAVQLAVDNMTCGKCVGRVERALKVYFLKSPLFIVIFLFCPVNVLGYWLLRL